MLGDVHLGLNVRLGRQSCRELVAKKIIDIMSLRVDLWAPVRP